MIRKLSWEFPIFISTRAEPNSWRKFTPNSNLSVTSPGFVCPFVLCEVISDPNEMDRWRMLSEAIAATRAGYFLMGDGFFIVAIYLRSNLTAERYLVMQTDPDGKVSIAQKDFKLTDSDEAIDFLREMYNLTAKVEALAAGLDPSKQNVLKNVAVAARPMISLTQPQKDKKDKSKTTGRSTITSEEDYFADLEIQRHLEEMGYEIDGVLFGHEHVAKISSPSDRGFLKFTRREKEVQILERLAGIVDPANHTITGTHVWKMQSGGYIIYMSSGGGHLTSLIQPDAHLWSVAEQLVEAVGFMHRHGVAHLDIKPQNVLIPVHGGRLSIIDFSIAAFVRSPQTRFKGTGGTEGYMAPEVVAGHGTYDAIRADLWSCGKTLEDLCLVCTSSPDRAPLLGMAQRLMSYNPMDRPLMSDVLKWMSDLRAPPDCLPTR
ncbi:kinase-like domain-containing protein [Melanogaster broomeanus]|nr:kinase-like domain-containing protein [Melanogaster broomeanus]